MLKGITNTFINACNSNELDYSEYIVLEGTTIPIRAKLTDDCYENGNFFGNFIFKTISFEASNEYNFRNKEFVYYKKVNNEAIKIGTFITTEIQDNDTKEIVKVVGMDYGLKTQVEYTSELDYASGEVTLKDVWDECCSLSGLQSGMQSFENDSFIVDGDQFTGTGATIRDVFIGIAMSSGSFVKVANDDKIYLVFKEQTNEIIEDYTELEDKRDTHPITCLRLGMSEVEGENVDIKDPELVEEYGENWLILNDNPFAYSQEKRLLLITAIFNKVKGFGYSSFVSKTSFKPYLTCGDLVKFRNKNGNLVNTILLRYNHEYKENDMQITLEAPSETTATVNYVYPTTAIDVAKRAEIKIDKANLIIEDLVSKVQDVQKTVVGTGSVTLENAFEGELHRIEIIGNISKIFPNGSTKYGYPAIISDDLIVGNNVYISSGIPYVNKDAVYPSETLYPKDSYLMVDDVSYKLDIDYLNYMNNAVCDKYVYEDGKQWIERNVGIDSNGDMYALDTPMIENKEDIYIIVHSESVITLKSFSNAIMKVQYLIENQYTTNFATKVYVDSSIRQTTDEIELKVQSVSDTQGNITAASIKTAINQDTSEVQIEADNININGVVSANGNFEIDLDGNMTCNDANINGDIITPNGVLTNLLFDCELWGWSHADAFNGYSGGFVGYNYDQEENPVPSYLNFSVRIPENFTLKSAKVHLRHSPVSWANSDATAYQNGSCKNMKVYKASGLGQSGYAAYYSEFIIGGTAPYLQAIDTEPATLSFSDTQFEEKVFDIPIETFNSAGTHNIVIKTSDAVPTGVTWQNAYQKLGSQTGILTGVLEIIGYTNNV